MANARQAALQARRGTDYSKIRLLAPSNNGVSSIARQNAANEADVMISKYNAGLIGNQEMKDFFSKQLTSPYVSASDKVDIQTQLRDFDTLIEKDRLEAVYKSSPDNSLQKEQAAQALAQFYTQRASTMVAGTPAHSQALENAGNWQNTVESIHQSVNKQQRRNLENALLQKVNALPTSSSQRSQAQADMYKQLYDMAIAQGDEQDAQAYAAKYEQAQTYAQQYAELENAQQTKDFIKQTIADKELEIAKLTDNSVEELRAKAQAQYDISQLYNQVGDQYNATRYLTMATQAEEKYNKKVSSMSIDAFASSWDQRDDEYKKTIKDAQKKLANGEITMEQYAAGVANLINQRKTDISERISYVEQLDPNERLKINGVKTRAENILQNYYTERDTSSGLGYGDKSEDGGLDQKLKDFASGDVVAVLIPPKEVSKLGNVSVNGSEVATIQFVNKNNLVDPTTGEISSWVQDESGIYHKSEFEKQKLTTEQARQAALNNGYYTDENGVSYRTVQGQDGETYIQLPSKFTKVYKPGSAESISQNIEQGKPVQSYQGYQGAIQEKAKQDHETKAILEQGKKNVVDATAVAPLPAKPPIQQAQEVLGGAAKQAIPKAQEAIQTVKESVGPVANKVKETVQPVVQPVVNKVQDVVSSIPTPIKQAPIKTVSDFINPPSVSAPSNSYSMPNVKTVNNVPSVKQYDVNQGFTYKPIEVPKPVKAPEVKQPSIGTVISGAAGQAFNKLKSLFKF